MVCEVIPDLDNVVEALSNGARTALSVVFGIMIALIILDGFKGCLLA